MSEFVLPKGKLVATAPISTETVAVAPPVSVPLVGESVSQPLVFARDQLNAFVPVFISVKDAGLGVNGPPTGPLEDNTVGLICKSSGRSYASTTPLVVELPGEVALSPMPRLANAAHSWARLAPP